MYSYCDDDIERAWTVSYGSEPEESDRRLQSCEVARTIDPARNLYNSIATCQRHAASDRLSTHWLPDSIARSLHKDSSVSVELLYQDRFTAAAAVPMYQYSTTAMAMVLRYEQ